MSEFEKWQWFAASWGSVYFATMFVVAIGYALWPSRKRVYDEAALIPLKDD